MDKDQKELYLSAVDEILLPHGFKRRSRSFEWVCASSSTAKKWVHLNFGLAVINPSFGVTYEDIAKLLPPEANSIQSTGCMLQSLTGQPYSEDTAPAELAKHVESFVLPKLDMLVDREKVIHALQSDMSKNWPVLLGFSARIRLLPLMLLAHGRKEEALSFLSQFEQIAPSRDQLLPRYSDFADSFRSKYLS